MINLTTITARRTHKRFFFSSVYIDQLSKDLCFTFYMFFSGTHTSSSSLQRLC